MTPTAHFWTLWPVYRHRLRPQSGPSRPEQVLRWPVTDETRGQVVLDGRLTRADPERLLVLVHGLGGSTESLYMLRAARQAVDGSGLSCLRLNMRGSDRQGEDIYHAGLTSDLAYVLERPELRDFRQIYVLGFSVGGHVVLRYATRRPDPRVQAVAAVCSPLDLSATVDDFDRPGNWLYRKYILTGLKALYAAVARRHTVPVALERIQAVRMLREWDSLTVVPRFGFTSDEDYYFQAGACRHLHELGVPALLVASEGDPMVTSRSIRRGLERAQPHDLEVRWTPSGGHVGFPDDLNLGEDAAPGLDPQVQAWLLKNG